MYQILLIDDDELLRDTVTQLLEADGHRVTVAADGSEGLRTFRGGRFDLVVTDMLMPGLDGAGVILALRETAPTLPIVAISGGRRVLTPGFNLQTALLAGATVPLAKPFGRAELRAAIEQAFA